MGERLASAMWLVMGKDRSQPQSIPLRTWGASDCARVPGTSIPPLQPSITGSGGNPCHHYSLEGQGHLLSVRLELSLCWLTESFIVLGVNGHSFSAFLTLLSTVFWYSHLTLRKSLLEKDVHSLCVAGPRFASRQAGWRAYVFTTSFMLCVFVQSLNLSETQSFLSFLFLTWGYFVCLRQLV